MVNGIEKPIQPKIILFLIDTHPVKINLLGTLMKGCLYFCTPSNCHDLYKSVLLNLLHISLCFAAKFAASELTFLMKQEGDFTTAAPEIYSY